ncbi:MAG: hypothetical protein ACI8TP_001148 [Acidimicrobiales bacterium]|jgi:hypothetical protein
MSTPSDSAVTNAIVIYESLTGNTATAAKLIAAELSGHGIEASASPINAVDLEALSKAQLVVVGSWVDGLFLFGQKPGRDWRLKKLPVIDGKLAAVFCTYAIEKGKTLDKLDRIVSMRGGDVIGGYGIKRSDIQAGAEEFAGRLLSALDTRQASDSSLADA